MWIWKPPTKQWLDTVNILLFFLLSMEFRGWIKQGKARNCKSRISLLRGLTQRKRELFCRLTSYPQTLKPQSSYVWRYAVTFLPKNLFWRPEARSRQLWISFSLFVADSLLPGSENISNKIWYYVNFQFIWDLLLCTLTEACSYEMRRG